MTEAVIARINKLAVGQPSQSVFMDQTGLPIGNISMEHFDKYNNNEADDNLPGVHLPDPDKSAKIPGVESTNQDPYEHEPDLKDAFDNLEVDFDNSQDPQDLVQADNEIPDSVVGETLAVKPGVGDTLAGGTVDAPVGVRR